ncbi:hypothetical protein PAMP_011565 [Pampus punctatissimus]
MLNQTHCFSLSVEAGMYAQTRRLTVDCTSTSLGCLTSTASCIIPPPGPTPAPAPAAAPEAEPEAEPEAAPESEPEAEPAAEPEAEPTGFMFPNRQANRGSVCACVYIQLKRDRGHDSLQTLRSGNYGLKPIDGQSIIKLMYDPGSNILIQTHLIF